MRKKIKYINREISWLQFNERVLQEAMDEGTPVLERLKFLGIFSNNRDEFFRVRVGTLNRMIHLKRRNYYTAGDPEVTLQQINEIVSRQEEKFTSTYNQIVEELKQDHIFLLNEKDLSEKQGEFVADYFKQHVRVHLFPLIISNLQDWNTLKDNSIYLAVVLKSSDPKIKENHALIKVPTSQISRFVVLPEEKGKKYIIILDDVIRFMLHDIFSIYGYTHFEAFTIKFTKDAELDIDNDISKSFLEIMSESVKQRKKGMTVRFVYDLDIPERLLKKIMKRLNISEHDKVRGGGRYHNFKDFMNFPKIGSDELRFPNHPPLEHKELNKQGSLLDAIRKKDFILHYPYQSFHYVIDILREASIDPKVRAIKMTFYRAARDSSLMNALINAARNGKVVKVFMELQARFDEESNIYWSEKLQEEGIHIIKTIPGFKVHAKMILIRRKENEKNIYYTNLSTGNYNESTAKVYSDISLFTADQRITTEVNRIFHLLEESFNPPNFKHLIVAPFHIRKRFINFLNQEIRNAKAGKEAWAVIKLNSLVDDKIVDKLYQASQAGVNIKLLARGICILNPEIPESKNIEAFSIVDKFLEHSRIYIFANGGSPRYYISSADWMQRNFDHRVELACPIYDTSIQKEIWDYIQIQLIDNVKARNISIKNPNTYRDTGTQEIVRSQFAFYEYLKEKHQ